MWFGGLRLTRGSDVYILGRWRELYPILLESIEDIRKQGHICVLFKFQAPLLYQIHNLLQDLHKRSCSASVLTSLGIYLLLRITTSTCMKSLVPTCLWNEVAHLSINMSRRPSDKNITFGSFVKILFLI